MAGMNRAVELGSHSSTSENRLEQRRLFPRGAWKLTMLPYLGFILLPLSALFLRVQPANIWLHLQQDVVQQAIRVSMETSLIAVFLTVMLGTPVAYYLSHGHYRFHRFIDALVDLPTVLPPAVTGVALLMAFGRRGLVGPGLGELGINLPFTSAAVIMAQMFVAAPFYIKSTALGLSAVNCELKKAAALDGASRWQTFRYILAPAARMAALSGAVMTWARAMGEFGATIIFAGNFPGRTQTMPLAIYMGFEVDFDIALTLAVILIGISFLVMIFMKAFFREHLVEGLADQFE